MSSLKQAVQERMNALEKRKNQGIHYTKINAEIQHDEERRNNELGIKRIKNKKRKKR